MSNWKKLAAQARKVLAQGAVSEGLAGRLRSVLAGAELTFGERGSYAGLPIEHKPMALRYALTRGLQHGPGLIDSDVRGDLALACWMDRELAAFARADAYERGGALSLSLGWGWPDDVPTILDWIEAAGGVADELLEEAIRESPVLDAASKVALNERVGSSVVRLRCWFDMAVAMPELRTQAWVASARTAAEGLAADESPIDRHFWLMAVDSEDSAEHWQRGLRELEACDGVLGDIAALRHALYSCAVTSESYWAQVATIASVKPEIRELPARRDGLLYDAVHSTRYFSAAVPRGALDARAAKLPKKMTSPLMAASAMALLAAREHERGRAPTDWLAHIAAVLEAASEEPNSAMVLSKMAGLCAGASQSWCEEMAPRIASAGARTMWLVSSMTPQPFSRRSEPTP